MSNILQVLEDTHITVGSCKRNAGCAETSDDGSVETPSWGKAVAVRFGIMALVVLVAVLAYDVLGSVESIVGAVCSMTSSMLLPAFFFLRYK